MGLKLLLDLDNGPALGSAGSIPAMRLRVMRSLATEGAILRLIAPERPRLVICDWSYGVRGGVIGVNGKLEFFLRFEISVGIHGD